jgi:hypothetical protein
MAGAELPTIRTWWYGRSLSIYERLSLTSFLQHGHPVELWCYEELDAPEGVQLEDASGILPREAVFSFAEGPAKGSYMAAADVFRFALLERVGGIWADLDVLCLRPFDDLPPDWVPKHVNFALLGLSAGNPISRRVLGELERIGQNAKLGDAGIIYNQALAEHPGDHSLVPGRQFFPFSWEEAWMVADPNEADRCRDRLSDAYCLHWWGSAISAGIGLPATQLPPRGSYLFEMGTEIFGTDALPAADAKAAEVWCRNFRELHELKARRARPLRYLLRIDTGGVAPDARSLAVRALRHIERWPLGNFLIRALRTLAFRRLASSRDPGEPAARMGAADHAPVRESGAPRRSRT